MDKKVRAGQVYELFKKHLTNQKFMFDPHDDDLVISMTVHGEDLPQPTLVMVDADREVVRLLSPLPTKIPEDKRIDAAVDLKIDQLAECVIIDTVCGEGGDKRGGRAFKNGVFHSLGSFPNKYYKHKKDLSSKSISISSVVLFFII